MQPVTERRSWKPYPYPYPRIWLGILYYGLPFIKGQSNSPEVELKSQADPNYGPIFSVPHAVIGSLVSDPERLPKDYIAQDGNDIGSKAVKDAWKEYFATQNGLMIVILLLLLLFLAVPIVGLIYACFCGRCKKSKRSSTGMRFCCGILLAISAILMLLFLIFAILAAAQLNKNLKKVRDCQLQKSSRYTKEKDIGSPFNYTNPSMRRIGGFNESELNVTQAEAHAKYIEKLSKLLQRVKPLLAELQDELPRAKWLALKLRDVLGDIKRNLKVFLTSQCSQEECQDFYRNYEIGMLDMGCLQYDRLPPTKDFTKSIQKVLDSNFAQQLLLMAKATRNPMSNLQKTFKKDNNKGAAASLVKLRLSKYKNQDKVKEQPTKANKTSVPAPALRRKIGPLWYGMTVGMLVLFLLVPILILIGLLVALFNPYVASWLLCAVLIAIFVLFSLALMMVLFFLVHGALTYQGFCSGQGSQQVSKKLIDSIEDLPMKNNLTRSLTELRAGDSLLRCVRNESLHRVLDPKELEDLMKKDGLIPLEKMESASLPSNLSSIHSQAEVVARELLVGNLSSYNISQFTRYICQELVPEPKPGPLPGLITKLEDLARRLGSPAILLNQTTYMRTAHKQLGQPLAVIVQRLLDKLGQLDHLLSGGYESLVKYMRLLLARIMQGDLHRDAKKVTQNTSYFLESHLLGNSTKDALEICAPGTREESLSPLTSQESRSMKEYNVLCNRITKPMNAIWFWLLLFALMLLPAICCTHYLRCRLRRLRHHSQETLVSMGEENYVTAGMLPLDLPRCTCYKYLPVAPETNVDQLEARNDYYVNRDYR